MTINIDQTATLLQASLSLIEQRREIEVLKAEIVRKDQRIAALECQARRSTLPFNRDQNTPALLRPQAG